MAGAQHFFAVVSAVQHLVGAERPGHAYVRLVAEHVIGASELGLYGGNHEVGRAWAEPDNRQPPPCTADL